MIPDAAPFSPEQRAWLSGFFSGLVNVPGGGGSADGSTGAGAPPQHETNPAEGQEDFPWHDPALPMDERMTLAEGKPPARKLMAAMAQLDCGACGYLCETYSAAIAGGAEKDLTKCTPGGKETKQEAQRAADHDHHQRLGQAPAAAKKAGRQRPRRRHSTAATTRSPPGWSSAPR